MDVCFLCLRVRFLLLPPRSPPVPVSVSSLFLKGGLRTMVPSLGCSDGGAGLCLRRKTSDEGGFLCDSCDNTAG